MYCRWCGMESSDDERCSWCGKSIPKPMVEDSAVPEEFVKQPEPVKETEVPIGDPWLEGMKEPAEEPRPPKPKPEIEQVEERAPASYQDRLAKYLSAMLVLLALGMLVVHYHPEAWLSQFFPLLLISALLMGAFRIIPDYHDKSMRGDVTLLLVLSVIAGPLYAALLYWLKASIKGKVNIGIVGLMASYLVIRLQIGIAAHGVLDTLYYLMIPNLSLYIVSHAVEVLPIIMLIIGWIASQHVRSYVSELEFE